MSLLIAACKAEKSNLESFQALLKRGDLDIDFQEPETGNTVLCTAISHYKEDFALTLIKGGANLKLANSNGRTPLMIACFRNLPFIAKEIASRLTDLEVSDGCRRTALALASQHTSLKTVKMLIGRGASALSKSALGRTVFHHALMGGQMDTAEYFLALHDELFSVHDSDSEDNQPLHLVAMTGKASAAEWLIARGAEVDKPGKLEMTPLMVASGKGKIDAARVLVKAGADIGLSARWNSLGYAVYHAHYLMARELLLWGADPYGVGTAQQTARQIAVLQGHGGVVKLLDAWVTIQSLWVVRSAGMANRISACSKLKCFPKDMCRMLGSMLVSL
jgi:ankyrin repeat protein